MQDPYSILGVSRNASQTELKQNYRRLAKELHPDRQPGDSAAAERFKDISAAYHVLGDSKQRVRFDRGEIDAYGNRRAPFKRPADKEKKSKQKTSSAKFAKTKASAGSQSGFHTSSSSAHQASAGASANAWTQADAVLAKEAGEPKSGFENFGFGGFSASDLFQPFFRYKRATDDNEASTAAGNDQRYRLEIDLLDASKGGKKRLSLKSGRDVFINVPVGVENGQIIRLKGQGEKVENSNPGDALVEISITPHAYFRREGRDIQLDLPVTISEAVEGARIAVPTIDGPVSVTVPKGSNAGTRLRLRGKGAIEPKTGDRGDQHLTLRIVLPDSDNFFNRLVKEWSKGSDYDVRGIFR